MQFFAIQTTPYEDRHLLAELVLRKAEDMGFQSKTLEALDVIEVGSSKYVRFRIDLTINQIDAILTELHRVGRSVIVPGGPYGYVCRMKDGRTGIVAYSKMQLSSTTHPREYRGNAVLHWERQFLKENPLQENFRGGTDGH
jgi:hypothetical protein